MTLTTWIVPDPDPALSLRIEDIDITTLTYEDLRFISSSTMKKYYREFTELENFQSYAKYIYEIHTINKRLSKLSPTSRQLNKHTLLPTYHTGHTTTKCKIPDPATIDSADPPTIDSTDPPTTYSLNHDPVTTVTSVLAKTMSFIPFIASIVTFRMV